MEFLGYGDGKDPTEDLFEDLTKMPAGNLEKTTEKESMGNCGRRDSQSKEYFLTPTRYKE